jgi:hypothetical protein
MDYELDGRISSLLPICSIRWIVAHVHVGGERIRAVWDARHAEFQLPHLFAPLVKGTCEVKQRIIELTISRPTISDLQREQLLYEQSGVVISRSTVNRTRGLAHFSYLPPRRCQVLTEQQRRHRTQFARDFPARKPALGNLVFCDE